MNFVFYRKTSLIIIALCLLVSQRTFAGEISAENMKEIEENCMSWEGEVIKVWCFGYRDMKPIAQNKYRAYLYGEYGYDVYAEFDEEGKDYLTKIKSDNEKLVYGKLETRTRYTDSYGNTIMKPCLILLGKRRHIGLGGKVDYCW